VSRTGSGACGISVSRGGFAALGARFDADDERVVARDADAPAFVRFAGALTRAAARPLVPGLRPEVRFDLVTRFGFDDRDFADRDFPREAFADLVADLVDVALRTGRFATMRSSAPLQCKARAACVACG
jgi:hypothetical protein